MSISKYMVVIVLATVALGILASGQYGMRQGQASGLIGKAIAIAGTIGQPGINAYTILAIDPMTHSRCMQSCLKSFPDKSSAGYIACVKGC